MSSQENRVNFYFAKAMIIYLQFGLFEEFHRACILLNSPCYFSASEIFNRVFPHIWFHKQKAYNSY